MQRIQRDLRGGEEQLPITVARPPRARGPPAHGDVGVHVEGLDDVMVRLSRCCTPVPGDEIMGFVTRGRGVSVHRTDCANAVSLRSQADRVIDVEWDNDAPGNYTVSVEIEALDRSQLLRDVADVLSEHHVNILVVHVADAGRPHRPAAVRVRARRSRPSRLDPRRGEAGRLGVRRDPRAARRPRVTARQPHPGRVAVPDTPASGSSGVTNRPIPPAAASSGPRSSRRRGKPAVESRVHVRRDGFTIVEVVVAITLLVIALLGAALLFENGIVASGNTRNRVVAQQIASPAIEKVRGTAADPTRFTTITAGPRPSRPRSSTACSSRSPRTWSS